MATTSEWKRKRLAEENRNEMRRQRIEQTSEPLDSICAKLREWGVKVGVTVHSIEEKLCAIGTDRELSTVEWHELHELFNCTKTNTINLGKSSLDPVTIYFKY